MIVQTGSTNPRGPVRRGLRAAGLATPLVLLAAVVGAGLLGPRPEPDDPPTPLPSTAAEAEAVEAPPVEDPGGLGPAFPTVAADLAVLSVPAAQPRLAAVTGRPLAVAGWLGSIRSTGACLAAETDTRGPYSPLCERRARLTMADPGAGISGAHLHLRIPAGVRLPEAFEARATASPMAVAIVGRPESPGAECTTWARGCGQQMILDRVTWADGAPFDPGAVFDAGLEVPPAALAYRRLPEAVILARGWAGTVLVAAAVRPATVAAIDPVASAQLSAAPAPDGLVWYVRALQTEYGPGRYPVGDAPPRLSWVVLDETTGATLAYGVEDPGGFPSMAAGLPVRDVGAVIDARITAPAGAVTAVAGWFRAWADPASCAAPIEGLPGTGCTREGLLVAGPWADEPGTTTPVGVPVLRAIVPPGVAIPDRAVGLPSLGLGPPPPVVAIGRLASPGVLVVEAIVWASGRAVASGRLVAAGTAVSPEDPLLVQPGAVREALGGAGLTLRMVLAPGDALEALDPEAAAGLGSAPLEAGATIWYLRGLDQASGEVRWAVVEPGTGRVLARDAAG